MTGRWLEALITTKEDDNLILSLTQTNEFVNLVKCNARRCDKILGPVDAETHVVEQVAGQVQDGYTRPVLRTYRTQVTIRLYESADGRGL